MNAGSWFTLSLYSPGPSPLSVLPTFIVESAHVNQFDLENSYTHAQVSKVTLNPTNLTIKINSGFMAQPSWILHTRSCHV